MRIISNTSPCPLLPGRLLLCTVAIVVVALGQPALAWAAVPSTSIASSSSLSAHSDTSSSRRSRFSLIAPRNNNNNDAGGGGLTLLPLLYVMRTSRGGHSLLELQSKGDDDSDYDDESSSDESSSSRSDTEQEEDDGADSSSSSISAHTKIEEADAIKARTQTAFLNAGLGGMALVRGIVDYVARKSSTSSKLGPMLLGLSLGGLMLRSALWIFQNNIETDLATGNKSANSSAAKGYKVATAAAAILSFITTREYFRTGVYAPTGIIATLSIIAFFYNGVDTLVEQGDAKEAAAAAGLRIPPKE